MEVGMCLRFYGTLSSPLHYVLEHKAAIMAVVLYSALAVRDHYVTCTFCRVNSYYYMEKHGVITGLQTAMLSCAIPSL